MRRQLLRPGWMVAAVVVVAAAILFVRLGVWQLDRLQERRSDNRVGEERFNAPPLDLATALEEAGGDLESLRYRRVRALGSFDPSEEVLIRSQVHLGQAGYHVITPLLVGEGAVLVNRGWVPSNMDRPPVEASPPEGETEVIGWVALSQQRPPLGREDPAGTQPVLSRVDIARIAEQTPYPLAPVYIVMLRGSPDELPAPVRPPDFDDEGPHLGYALQWFGFAIVAVVGFYFLTRRRVLRGGSPPD